jgi:hypothetical protein
MPHADAVDPAAEVRRGRNIRTDRDDPGGNFRGNARQVEQKTPQGLLCRLRTSMGDAEFWRRFDRRPCIEFRGDKTFAGRRTDALFGAAGTEVRPGVARVGAQFESELVPLFRRQEGGMVPGVTLRWQAPGLDRVGEDDCRPVFNLGRQAPSRPKRGRGRRPANARGTGTPRCSFRRSGARAARPVPKRTAHAAGRRT